MTRRQALDEASARWHIEGAPDEPWKRCGTASRHRNGPLYRVGWRDNQRGGESRTMGQSNKSWEAAFADADEKGKAP